MRLFSDGLAQGDVTLVHPVGVFNEPTAVARMIG